MSDTVGVSPTNDSLSDSDCVTDTVSSDVDILPNCDGDNSNTKNVNTRCVNVENVNGCRLNTDSVNPVDKRCSHLSQNVSVLTQSDSDDAVLSSTTKSVAPLHTSDTADVTVTHVIAPVCDTIVSVRAVTMTTADDIAEVDAASMCMSSTVANSTTPPVNAVTSDNVTSSLVRPTTHDQSDVSDCTTSSHHGPDLIISSSKITKRKCVGSEPVVIKREKLDTGYDKATAGSQGRVSSKATARSQRQGGRRQGQVSRSQGQVSRGQGQVSRGHVQVMSQPVTTLNPASAPHLARHLMQGIVGKESLSKLGRPPVKTVTLRMLPSAGHVTATSDAAQVGYPVWKRTQAVAASKSDTFVIMTQSVGSSQTPVPFTAVARPYVLVTTSATSVVRPQFIQSQPKIQTVTIVPATSAPPRGRLKQLSVPSVPYGRSKALSRPNSVPTYKCPMPPLELFNEEPPKTFICGECHDTFYHERSLQQHLNRKSVSIRIHCIACKTQLLFYNHCAFLMHVRSHRRGSLDTFGLHRAKITPLPQHFMPAVYWSVSNSDPGSAPVSRAAQTTDSSPVVSSASATPQPERSTTPRTKHDAVEKSPDSKTPFMCIECHSTYTSQGQLQHHLAVKVGQKLYHCNRCPMVMRNPCRYNAHVRVHRKQRPYVCPECGELIRGSHAVFLKHVKWRCLHFTRTVRFTCTHNCNAHFESELRYINHVVAKHVSNYYKCLSCPMAFCTDDAFDKHNVAVHASTAVMQHIIKCSYCDTVYQRHTELTTHMTKSHQTELWGLMHYVFKCPHCKHVRATKYDLIKHMETAHEFTYMLSMCNVCGQEMAGRLLATHKSECHPFDDTKKEQFQWQCNKCSESFPSSARLHKHRRVHNGNAHNTLFTHKSPDGDKSSDEVNSETNSKFAEPTPEFCCSLCSENFSKQTELTSHLRAKHDIIPQFPCHLCGLTYENEADTKRHIADVHEGKKAVAPPTFTCWLCSDDDDASRHFKKRRGLINHLSTVHRIPKNNLDIARLSSSLSDSSGAEGSTEAIPPPAPALKRLKTDSDSKFVCAKCDFSGVDRATFVKHIVKHRALDNPWQCHECALCFTSRPSLRRHLFMVHRVRDFKRYSREAGIDLDVPVVDIKEEEDDELMCGTFVRPTLPPPMQTVVAPAGVDNPLECTVCYKQFDEESAKRAHMRTHGMAFIYSRRRATKPVQ